MSTEQNKSIVRRYIEDVWGRGQTSLLSQVVANDMCDHAPIPGQPLGLEGQRWGVDFYHRSFPDLQIRVDRLVAEGDRVVDQWTCTGTHTGEMFGMQPTGKRVSFTGTDMTRLENGKIQEVWHVEDLLTMMQQLGAVPASPQGGGFSGRTTTSGGGGSFGRGRTTSDDERRELIRHAYQQFIDRANTSEVDRLLSPDFVGHFSGFPPIRGRDEFRQFIAMWNGAVSPNRTSVEDVLIDGDFAACRVTFAGKHSGELMGIPASGKQTSTNSLSVFRFVGDMVAEQWANNDDLGLLQQIGAVPMTAGAEMATPC